MKKIVIFGGGTGLSQLIKGLQLFPVDITSVVTVADNGKSTGKLREEYQIPAVGDISKVLIAMSPQSDDIKELMNYRFTNSKALENHSIKNLLLTALLDLKGDFKHALPILEELLDVKGRILPITEENVDLVGITEDNKIINGEAQITASTEKIKEITYNKKFRVNEDVIEAINEADLIIVSSGSLFTSIYPHLCIDELNKTINKSTAKKLYVCNLVTQPGETDDFKVSDHVNAIRRYINIDIVIANSVPIDKDISEMYATKEQKNPVDFDFKTLQEMNIEVLADKLFTVEDNILRHDALKTAYLIFSYLMRD